MRFSIKSNVITSITPPHFIFFHSTSLRTSLTSFHFTLHHFNPRTHSLTHSAHFTLVTLLRVTSLNCTSLYSSQPAEEVVDSEVIDANQPASQLVTSQRGRLIATRLVYIQLLPPFLSNLRSQAIWWWMGLDSFLRSFD